MIRFIAAIDSKKGLADDNGIPWQGKLPTDVSYFREKTLGSTIMMGYGWYSEQQLPLSQRRNVVATSSKEPLRPGFEVAHDALDFLKGFQGEGQDIWVGGGAKLFENTISVADELYLTRINKDFNCTKFFPQFEDRFKLMSRSEIKQENDIEFCFEVWEKN